MRNEKLRKAISAYVADMEFDGETILLDNHDFDNSIVGITDSGRVVYDYNRMIKEYVQDEHCSALDAIEWLEYNTLRAIPYMGEYAPIIILETPKTILSKYGE